MPKPKTHATRVALVTGAASGIGKAIATRLAAEGACVVIADLDLEKAQAAAAELGNTDVAIGVQANVTDAAAVQAAVDEAVLAFGGIDLVVNNAGLSLSKPLLETTEADWDLQHDVMAKGSFLVSKAAARVLIDQGLGGDIVYISSKNSVFAGPNNIAYSATKADQAHQVRLLAVELGEHGIRVNGINPDGVVRGSGIFAGGWGANRAKTYGIEEEDLGKFYAQRTILKREVLPEHVANAVVRAHRPRAQPHDRPAHPGRRGRRRGVPAMTDARAGTVAAVDLGATSGRVMLGRVDGRGRARSSSDTVAPLPERPGATRRRAALGPHRAVRARCSQGSREALRAEPRRREHRHRLVGRRLRTAAAATAARRAVPLPRRPHRGAGSMPCTRSCRSRSCTARNGLQFLPFNTLYQLAAERDGCLDLADSLLLMPDLIAFRLTGGRSSGAHERVDDGALSASTTGEWDDELIERLGSAGIRLRPTRRARANRSVALRGGCRRGLGAAPGIDGRRGRIARHRVGRRRRADATPSRPPTSRAAPGASSASSSSSP